jgi:hypothetical protein
MNSEWTARLDYQQVVIYTELTNEWWMNSKLKRLVHMTLKQMMPNSCEKRARHAFSFYYHAAKEKSGGNLANAVNLHSKCGQEAPPSSVLRVISVEDP